jgi:hypothetical protein
MPWMHNQLDTRKINSTRIQRKRKELEPYILQENAWNNNKSHKVHTQAKHKYNSQNTNTTKSEHTSNKHKQNQDTNTNGFSQMSTPTNQTIEKHLFLESLQYPILLPMLYMG